VAKVTHGVAWTSPTQRQAGASAVADAARHERAAVAALRKALALVPAAED